MAKSRSPSDRVGPGPLVGIEVAPLLLMFGAYVDSWHCPLAAIDREPRLSGGPRGPQARWRGGY